MDLQALSSKFDENFHSFMKAPGLPYALATTRVDDNELANEKTEKARAWKKESHR